MFGEISVIWGIPVYSFLQGLREVYVPGNKPRDRDREGCSETKSKIRYLTTALLAYPTHYTHQTIADI